MKKEGTPTQGNETMSKVSDKHGWTPEVGDDATYSINCDRYPYRVVRISDSGKTIWLRALVVENGEPTDTIREHGETVRASLRKGGRYKVSGTDFVFISKGARYSLDPHF